MFVAHKSEYMLESPSMEVLEATDKKQAIMEAFGIEPDEDDDVDTLIKDAIAANGDGMSYITIFDTETNQQIVG